ncbi:MAG: amino acid ABC transporter ATP-binding protein [Parvibaculaceae bacterium]
MTAADLAEAGAAGPVLSCRSVRKRFGSVTVLDSLSLDVGRGEVICIIGPSGSGKSTLLRAINGLEPIESGSIEVAGISVSGAAKDLRQVRRSAGMVFQSFNLFPHMTVRRNLTLAPRRALKLSRAAADKRAEALLARVRMSDQIDKYPTQLSGGQQQRVAIARALAMEPAILLFDEPTSSLDPESVGEVLDIMRELAATRTTMLVVTHEMGFARQVADRVVFMDRGRIVCDEPPDVFFGGIEEPRIRAFLASILK